MVFVAAVFSLPILFADAPNPADCPHHQCDYHPATAGGIAAALVVIVVVVVLLVVLTVALVRRRRRRHRRARAGA
jgi:heme/copper-type cytochrome/quinol oxidase subunit 2